MLETKCTIKIFVILHFDGTNELELCVRVYEGNKAAHGFVTRLFLLHSFTDIL